MWVASSVAVEMVPRGQKGKYVRSGNDLVTVEGSVMSPKTVCSSSNLW